MLGTLNTNADTKYSWADISTVRDVPGIYAWYYLPELTTFDLNKTIKEVKDHVSQSETDQAKVVIEKFLNQCIFRYFVEDPYEAVFCAARLNPPIRGS